jgi:hypothetical protein
MLLHIIWAEEIFEFIRKMKLAASYIRVHVVVIKNDLADKVIIDVSLL